MSVKLSELTQTARREEELHLVEVKREPEHQQLAASPRNLEGSAAAAAITAVGPRAALAVIAEHLTSTCVFAAVKAAATISGQNRHPLLTQPPAKKRQRPPGSKDNQTPEAVRVKVEGTEVKGEVKAEETEVLKAEETEVKAEETEVKAEETELQPLDPKLEEAVAVTAVSQVCVDTPCRRISACSGQLDLQSDMLTCLSSKTLFCSHIMLVSLTAKPSLHCNVSSGASVAHQAESVMLAYQQLDIWQNAVMMIDPCIAASSSSLMMPAAALSFCMLDCMWLALSYIAATCLMSCCLARV